MSDRREELTRIADSLACRDDIADAYTAKSFTDRLFVVELPAGETVPDSVVDCLADSDVYPSSAVYSDDERPQTPFAGADDHDQFRFVDVQSRGEMQSYVVD